MTEHDCTCHGAPHALEVDVGSGPMLWDPECPRHGLDVQLELVNAPASPAGAQVEGG